MPKSGVRQSLWRRLGKGSKVYAGYGIGAAGDKDN